MKYLCTLAMICTLFFSCGTTTQWEASHICDDTKPCMLINLETKECSIPLFDTLTLGGDHYKVKEHVLVTDSQGAYHRYILNKKVE